MKTTMIETCTVKPDKWNILELATDYYRGKVELLVDLYGSAKVKQVGFTLPISLKDFLVQANNTYSNMLNVDDCHLCQCPEWKDLSLTTASLMMNIDRTVLMDCMDSVEKWGGGYVPGSSVRDGRQLGSFEP